MAESLARPARRGALGLAYGLTTALLLHVIAQDLAWVERALAEATLLVPELVRPAEATVAFAIVAGAAFATLLALGTFVLSRRTGTGFGLWIVATLAALTVPYGRVPWGQLAGASPGGTAAAPPEVWILAGGLVALATVEIGVCAREGVLAELELRGLPADRGSPAHSSTRSALQRWLAVSLLAGTVLVLGFALLHPVTEGLAGNLDLLWVPALAGLVAGMALWLWARDERT